MKKNSRYRHYRIVKVLPKVAALALALGTSSALYAQNPITFSGTIYQDGDGSLISGNPIGKVATGSQTPQRIYVYLLDNSNNNKVIAKKLVEIGSADLGQYTIDGLSNASYNLRISTSNVALNVVNPTLGFNIGFVPTAEGATTMGDGQPDYGVAVNAANNLNVDFAINALPVGNNYTIMQPNFDGNNRIMISPAAFTASDQEDGIYQSGLNGRPVDLFEATGGDLYYDGTLINFYTASTATRINNFDPNNLRVELKSNSASFSFAFATVDNAGAAELTPHTISTNATPLAISVLQFSARRQGDAALVEWATAKDEEGEGFDLERSTDGISFSAIAHIASLENEAAPIYRYEDQQVSQLANGQVHYRLRQTSLNGNSVYSKTATIAFGTEKTGDMKLAVFPNPVRNTLNVSIANGIDRGGVVSIVNATGSVLLKQPMEAASSRSAIDVSNLPAGFYLVQYQDATGMQQTARFVISR